VSNEDANPQFSDDALAASARTYNKMATLIEMFMSEKHGYRQAKALNADDLA